MLERIAAAAPDVLVVCAYGVLIREPLLSAYEIFNVHPSLLPRWRGAAPVERAIMAGDAETGVSIMRLTAGLDSGPVCAQARTPIAPDDDYASVAGRLTEISGELLVAALDYPAAVGGAGRGARDLRAQDRGGRPGAGPARPPAEVERVVRALRPHIGARLPCRTGASSASAARASTGRPWRPRAAGCGRTGTACCSTAAGVRSSSSRSSRPAGGRWRRPRGCAGARIPP